jgi:hypothetical protein
MSTTNLGRIIPQMQGIHSSANTYVTLDRVQSGTSLYDALQNVPAGIAITNTTYWKCTLDNSAVDAAVAANAAVLNAAKGTDTSLPVRLTRHETEYAQNKLLYDFKDEATADVWGTNGAVINPSAKTITIPAGQTGNTSSYKFKQLINAAKYVGYTLKLHVQFSVSTAEITSAKVGLYLQAVINGTQSGTVGSTPVKTTLETNRYYYTKIYTIVSGISEIRPYLQIENTSALAADCVLTVERVAYEIIPVATKDIFSANEYALAERVAALINTMNKGTTSLTNIFTNQAADTEVVYDTTGKEKVVLEITRCYSVLLYVYGQLSGGAYVQIPLVNLKTGNALNFAAQKGKYFIDTRQFNAIKFANQSGDTTSRLTANVYTPIGVQDMPLQIVGDYNNKPPAHSVLTKQVTALWVHGSKNGELYAGSGGTIKKSSNWGVDGFPTTVCVVSDGTNTATSIYKMLFLTNGNILAIDRGGKMYLSTDNFATWTMVKDFGTTPPHEAFGSQAYQNIVVMTEYNTQKTPPLGTNVHVSEDYGATWNQWFEMTDHGFSNGCHTHDAKYDPYEGILWVAIGDGESNHMIFFTKDKGLTWNKVNQTYPPTQTTQIIPLRNCVLFLSDSRTVCVTRYNRPVTGTHQGQDLTFETAKVFKNGWGKAAGTEVPIGSTAAIDYENSVAYFGFTITGNTATGNTDDDTLLKGQVYATDGYKFYEVFKNDEVVNSSGVVGVYGPDTDNDKSVVAHVLGLGVVRVNGTMW